MVLAGYYNLVINCVEYSSVDNRFVDCYWYGILKKGIVFDIGGILSNRKIQFSYLQIKLIYLGKTGNFLPCKI